MHISCIIIICSIIQSVVTSLEERISVEMLLSDFLCFLPAHMIPVCGGHQNACDDLLNLDEDTLLATVSCSYQHSIQEMKVLSQLCLSFSVLVVAASFSLQSKLSIAIAIWLQMGLNASCHY